MIGYLVRRLVWTLPTLLGITLVTFLMLELAPGDRATLAVEQAAFQGGGDLAQRRQAIERLERAWGMVDPRTGERYSVWRRWANWLGRVVRLDFSGPGEDPTRVSRRLGDALPVTVLVALLAVVVAVGGGVMLGAWQGMRAGGLADRLVSGLLFLLYGLPDFLVGTLLVLVFGVGIAGLGPLLPVVGLRSEGAEAWPWHRQLLDLAAHVVLPVATLALAPLVVVTRFVRESVARTARADFVLGLRALGLPERWIRRRVLRNALSPLVTLLGSLVPALLGGSVVVEQIFSLPGMGRLAFDAVMARDYPMVLAITLLGSVVTLGALILSDVGHRLIDPRVRLR